MRFKEFYKLIKENETSEKNKSVAAKTKNFYYALSSLLEKGDNFKYSLNSDTRLDNAASISFLYNGTRFIKVFYSLFFYNRERELVKDVSVSIFETNENGKTIEQLDKNVFNNPIAKNSYELSFDPTIREEPDFVQYIKSVLDRSDRDGDLEIQPLPPSTPNLKVPFKKKEQLLAYT